MAHELRVEDRADRIFGVLRLAAVPLVAASELYVAHPHETPTRFWVAVGAFAVYAVAALRPPARHRLVLTIGDLFFAGVLSFASGGGFSQFRFGFVFAPLASAFRRRPLVTFSASLAAAAIYLAQALAHPSRTERADAESFAAIQASYLLWIGLVATGLSAMLARHERELERLGDARQRLVAEAMAAEERERKRVAEVIHDDAIQHLLAARFELAAAGASEHVERADRVIGETVAHLRRTMAELHPHLLERAGLAAAARAAGERAAARGGFALDLRCAIPPGGGNEQVLLRSVGELLANAATHARAAHVTAVLERVRDDDVLRVADDGVGFDPAVLHARIDAGHIGLLSLRERAEALGGRFELATAPGAGTRVVLSLPARSQASARSTAAANAASSAAVPMLQAATEAPPRPLASASPTLADGAGQPRKRPRLS